MARLDAYLKKMAGGDNPTPAPVTSMDKSLNTLAESGGGGLPDYTEANPGDVLTAIGYGQLPQWIPPQGGGVFLVNMDMDTTTLDKTWQEIYDAAAAGQEVIATYGFTDVGVAAIFRMPCVAVVQTGETYGVAFLATNPTIAVSQFVADASDGYPVLQTDG